MTVRRLSLVRAALARVAFVWVSLALVGASCGGELPPRPGTPPQHLLLVTVAGLRADHVSGTYLYLRPTTAWPLETALKNDGQALAVDDLCEQGVALAAAFAPSPRARESLLALHTGFPSVVVDARPNVPTLAEALAKQGFQSRAFVSSRSLGDTAVLARGFATFEARASDAETLDAAAQALAKLDRGAAPHVFFWVHLDGPDAPFEPPALPPREGEAGGAIDFARRFVDPRYAGSIDGSLSTLEKLERGELELAPADRDRLVDLYDGEVAATAGLLRNFVSAWRNVDGSGEFFDRTLLVFAGTSGVDLYERARAEARRGAWIGVERVRVPLFFRHPGSLTGSRLLSEQVELTDVAPTVREWFLGLGSEDTRPPAGGRSLLPRFDTYVVRPFESRPALSLDLDHRAAALRTAEWTLLSVTPAGSTTPELRLYDRLRDPREEQDLAAIKPEKTAELAAELERRVAALKAP
ncbi:MAG: hypothetical protein IT453_15640 [Planctomycetes bacterium]|nr:hypothetical protein [Planctomycetota bacterium]